MLNSFNNSCRKIRSQKSNFRDRFLRQFAVCDGVVIDHTECEFLDPSHLEIVLSAVLDRRRERREHIAELNKRAAETELRLKRLYDAIEADLDDPALKDPHRGPTRTA